MNADAPDLHSISPGLALVDPDLAAAARALLPEPGAFRPNWQASTVPTAPRRERRLRAPAILVGTVAIATFVGGLGHALTEARPVAGSQPPPPGIQHADVARRATDARTYRWPSVPGAHSYDLRLLKGTKEVYLVTTTTPTTDVPADLHLAPGRYTWSVIPNLGDTLTNTTAPVIEGTFEARPAS